MAIERLDSSDLDALPAGADLSDKVFYAVKIDTATGKLVLAGNGERAYGIVREGAVLDRNATVAISGMTRVIAGAAVTAGSEVMVGAGGKIITAAGAGNAVLGIARGSASDEDVIFPVEIDQSRVPA